ncbi:hypothetical protein BGP_0194 [Beggiatoa sp. PS]|nr:hypothetical protein BGP_0194 [Beggiatoa sp. PS]
MIPKILTEKTNCHQTTISEHTPLTANPKLKHDEIQDCHENCCGDDCQCGHCICSGFGLIPSYVSMSFSIGILNHISVPIFLDWQPVLLLKPPRQFRR